MALQKLIWSRVRRTGRGFQIGSTVDTERLQEQSFFQETMQTSFVGFFEEYIRRKFQLSLLDSAYLWMMKPHQLTIRQSCPSSPVIRRGSTVSRF